MKIGQSADVIERLRRMFSLFTFNQHDERTESEKLTKSRSGITPKHHPVHLIPSHPSHRTIFRVEEWIGREEDC